MFESIFDFVSQLGTINILFILAIFIVFIFLVKKVIKTMLNILWIAIASAAFPFVLNFLGYSIQISIDNILFFVMLGVGIYFIYIFGKVVYSALGIFEKGAKIVTYPISAHSKHNKEDVQHKMEDFIKEREKREKELEKERKELEKHEKKK